MKIVLYPQTMESINPKKNLESSPSPYLVDFSKSDGTNDLMLCFRLKISYPSLSI